MAGSDDSPRTFGEAVAGLPLDPLAVLAVVLGGERARRPVTADKVEFLLSVGQEEVSSAVGQLLERGLVVQDGEDIRLTDAGREFIAGGWYA